MSACERDNCDKEGRWYTRNGSTVSVGTDFTLSSTGHIPDQPILLCVDHAVEAFGVGFA